MHARHLRDRRDDPTVLVGLVDDRHADVHAISVRHTRHSLNRTDVAPGGACDRSAAVCHAQPHIAGSSGIRSKRNHLRLLRLLVCWFEANATNLMASATPTSQRVLSASPEEQPELAKVVDLLAHLDTDGERMTRLVSPDGESIVLPASAFEALKAVVTGMAQGMAMTLVPSGRELTTQEAADLLRISRPSVIRLLEDGTIPFHKVGTHRRINVEDVLAYRAKRNEQRRAALRELTEISEEIGYH
jgi:excisionase family DNA binding protein